MNFTTWVEAEKGRAAALAARFGKTPAAVSQWKRNGVPVELMKAVRDISGGAVTLEEMVPGTVMAGGRGELSGTAAGSVDDARPAAMPISPEIGGNPSTTSQASAQEVTHGC